MEKISPLRNPIMTYAWGSRSAIAELLGQAVPSDQPQAELWMGAHPKAPSWVLRHGQWQPLNAVIAQAPEAFLGDRIATRFDGRLPFLFKVLAVEAPLSLQAHPNRQQAQNGFARENALGIALDASERNFRDAQHKPECVCALTPFEALCGFRPAAQIAARLGPLWPADQESHLVPLSPGRRDIHSFFKSLMHLSADARARLVQHVMGGIQKSSGLQDPDVSWVGRLNEAYPNDIGALAPLFLNWIRLAPGNALNLEAGVLHAYLSGVALELMANSDNVLRGGLTPKHIDVEQLLDILNITHSSAKIIDLFSGEGCERFYPSPFEEFCLSAIQVSSASPYHRSAQSPTPEILLCLHGDATIRQNRLPSGEDALPLSRGASVFVPASAGGYKIEGDASIYRASVPLA